MYRKLIACLLVFLLLCTPAYASTSSSALDYHVMSMSLDDGIIPASSVGSSSMRLQFRTIDLSTDVSTGLSSVSISEDFSGVSQTLLHNFFDTPGDYSSANPYLGFSCSFSDLSDLSAPGALELVLNNIHFNIFTDQGWMLLTPESMIPVQIYASGNWSGTGKYTNPDTGSVSYVTLRGTNRKLNCSSFADDIFTPVGLSAFYLNRTVGDLHFICDLSLPDIVKDGGYDYEVVSGSFSDITFYFYFKLVPSMLRSGVSGYYDTYPYVGNYVNFASQGTYGTEFRFVNIGNQNAFNLFYNANISGSSSGGQASLQQSLVNLGKNMTISFNALQDTLEQGATDVKNEISNQTTTLTDKLTDVKDGIVQGVTELKETTEQGFEDVVQGITDLPDKIQEMLIEFIVPDEDAVADKMTDFQDLAEEKLGIIYQVPEMLFDAVNALVDGATNPQSTMSFPAFSLPWIDGSQLRVWDSQQFEIIPSGLENLRDLIQTVTSMVFVIMTFNSLKRAYERFFLGGGS